MKQHYRIRYKPDHPRASSSGCVHEHVLIAEAALGRYLPVTSPVHHVDEDKRNNANRNLVICQDKAYHLLLHVRTRVLRAGGDPNTQALCCWCRKPKDFSEFGLATGRKCTGLQTACRECIKRYDAQRYDARRQRTFHSVDPVLV